MPEATASEEEVEEHVEEHSFEGNPDSKPVAVDHPDASSLDEESVDDDSDDSSLEDMPVLGDVKSMLNKKKLFKLFCDKFQEIEDMDVEAGGVTNMHNKMLAGLAYIMAYQLHHGPGKIPPPKPHANPWFKEPMKERVQDFRDVVITTIGDQHFDNHYMRLSFSSWMQNARDKFNHGKLPDVFDRAFIDIGLFSHDEEEEH